MNAHRAVLVLALATLAGDASNLEADGPSAEYVLTGVAEEETRARNFDLNEIVGSIPGLQIANGEEAVLTCTSEALQADGTGQRKVKNAFSGMIAEVDPTTLAILSQTALPPRNVRSNRYGYAHATWSGQDLRGFSRPGGRYLFRVLSRAGGNRRILKYRTKCTFSSYSPCTAGPTVACFGDGRYSVQTYYRELLNQPYQPARVQRSSANGIDWSFTVPSRTEMVSQILNRCHKAARSWQFVNRQVTPWDHRTVITDRATRWMYTVPRSAYTKGVWSRDLPGCHD